MGLYERNVVLKQGIRCGPRAVISNKWGEGFDGVGCNDRVRRIWGRSNPLRCAVSSELSVEPLLYDLRLNDTSGNKYH